MIIEGSTYPALCDALDECSRFQEKLPSVRYDVGDFDAEELARAEAALSDFQLSCEGGHWHEWEGFVTGGDADVQLAVAVRSPDLDLADQVLAGERD